MRNFRKLVIWQKAVEVAVNVYEAVKDFQGSDLYTIGNQMKRASVSVPSNIAEGCSRRSSADKRRFVEIALGSAYELETQLEIASKCCLLSSEKANELMNELSELQRRIYRFKQTVAATSTGSQ
jgi:four helix bundle protein